MIERRTIRFDHELLSEIELPCFEATGARDGPHLCLLGGVHGGEYSSIAAVVRFMQALDTSGLSGRVMAVPIVSMSSFRARTAFVVPEDGKNLNRCFPGSRDGTFADALAWHVFHELIEPSDALIDLHGGDMVEALEPFAIYDESPVEDRARALALAFGLPYVVRSATADAPVSGTTSSAAAAAGIPAVIAEAGGCGLLDEDAVQLHLRGLANALRRLGMLPGMPSPPGPGMRSVGRFVWLHARRAGWWEPDVRAGDERPAGSCLGTVRDLFGDVVERIEAPEEGVVLFLTSSPAVAAGGLLLGLGADVVAIETRA
jgi:predicted deacylase